MDVEDSAARKSLKGWLKLAAELSQTGNDRKGSGSSNDLDSKKYDELSNLCTLVFDALDKGVPNQQMNEVCQQIVALFRSKSKKLCLLVLELLPSLIWTYLSDSQSSKSKNLSGLEACLLTVYNLSLAYDSQPGKGTSYMTIPSLGKNSVYHEVGDLAGLTLTESALSRYDAGDKKLAIGPFPLVEKLNAKSRLPVLSHLIRCYLKEIGLLSSRSHQSLCALSIKVSCTGFKTYLSRRLLPPSSHPTEHNLIARPRIPVSQEFLCELLHGVYFVMFNGQPEHGLEVLDCVHQRANYELFSNVLLITNAIKNSLEHNPSGQPYDGPMGVSVSITPAHILSSLNKKAITNASFRTQKLPDDITPEGEDAPSDTDTESKAISTVSGDKQGKLLAGIKISKPLKSALRRVERSINQKKEGKDHVTASPSKTDGHHWLTRQVSGGNDKLTTNGHELGRIPSVSGDYMDAVDGAAHAPGDSYHTVVDHENIEIVIDPPPEEQEQSKV